MKMNKFQKSTSSITMSAFMKVLILFTIILVKRNNSEYELQKKGFSVGIHKSLTPKQFL